MRQPRLYLLVLTLLLVACSTTPAVPTPAAILPTAPAVAVTAQGDQPTPVPTAPEVATVVATMAPIETTAAPNATAIATTVAATDIPSTSTSVPEAPVVIGSVQPITYTLPEGIKFVKDTSFATFKADKPSITPQSSAPAIAADLGNVAVPFILSPSQKAMLGKQGFVISPGDTKEFFELYERARYSYEPVFVTSDSLLHVYHLLFDRTLRVVEQEKLAPMLASLDWAMLNTSLAQLKTLEGTPWQTAARRNAAYFAVAVKLLDPDWAIPDGLQDLTDPDLQAIAQHAGPSPSAIFPAYPYGEDWSQYVPRGHYTRSELLKRYFQAMMWHGRMTMLQDDTTQTQQAALMVQAWQGTQVEGQPATGVWQAIYDPTVFFVGRSDDLTPTEYSGSFDAVYGKTADPKALMDQAKFGQFQDAISKLRPPEILGMVISDQVDVEAATKGLRFMGQRFVPDSFVFRQLIHRNVPNRYLPKGLDLFAVLGSERALKHLTDAGDATMPKYQEQFEKIKQVVAGYDQPTWTQNLYWSWLYALRPLSEVPGDGYPQFMRSQAWVDKQLNTSLGSWTELRHDTILYAKQVYAEMGAGALPPPSPEPPKGYVEPVPEVYARIKALASMTMDGLKSRGLLLDSDQEALTRMVEIAGRLETIAEKELRGEALTAEEYEKIRFYGGDIEKLTFAAGLEPNEIPGGSPASDTPQAAIVADVATNPNDGIVLEEGVGRIFPIYVVVPIEGKLTVTIGGVFSQYEFQQPINDRLTDEKWQAMLEAGQAPKMEDWKQALIVDETPATVLADTIRNFNDKLNDAFWFTDIGYVSDYLNDPELADTKQYIDQLKGANTFVGMKRLSLDYLSFDMQDATHATVTTRESFSEELRKGSPTDFSSEPPVIGVRPPYTSTVSYTMVKEGDNWKINKIVVNSPPGDWQKP